MQSLDPDRRGAVGILLAIRWLLIAIALLADNYRNDIGTDGVVGIDVLIAVAALLNLTLQLAYLRDSVPVLLPVLTGLFDGTAVVLSVGIVDGFRSNNYILLYPALFAFGLVFPSRLSIIYTALTLVAYTAVVTTTHHSFRPANPLDQKTLLMRLGTLASTVYVANVVTRTERERRARAVAAEAGRSAELLALERRAREAEQAAEEERRRLSREVHDGISQDAYMLTLGLETVLAALARGQPAEQVEQRLTGLLGVAKQTLLESRNLLFDLAGVMEGSEALSALLRNQAAEFAAVSGIAVDVQVEGEEHLLTARTIGEVYRVVQESLSNIFRHAGAGRVVLNLTSGAADALHRRRRSRFRPGAGDARPRTAKYAGARRAYRRTLLARVGGARHIAHDRDPAGGYGRHHGGMRCRRSACCWWMTTR